MIQIYSRLKVCDNTGARIAMCIRVHGGSRRRYGHIGDIINVTIKDAMPNAPVKKGDKGKAVKILIELIKLNFGSVSTTGMGDIPNDVGVLNEVDIPVLVQTEGNRWNRLKVKNLKRAKGIGPEGWSQSIAELFGPK